MNLYSIIESDRCIRFRIPFIKQPDVYIKVVFSHIFLQGKLHAVYDSFFDRFINIFVLDIDYFVPGLALFLVRHNHDPHIIADFLIFCGNQLNLMNHDLFIQKNITCRNQIPLVYDIHLCPDLHSFSPPLFTSFLVIT